MEGLIWRYLDPGNLTLILSSDWWYIQPDSRTKLWEGQIIRHSCTIFCLNAFLAQNKNALLLSFTTMYFPGNVRKLRIRENLWEKDWKILIWDGDITWLSWIKYCSALLPKIFNQYTVYQTSRICCEIEKWRGAWTCVQKGTYPKTWKMNLILEVIYFV